MNIPTDEDWRSEPWGIDTPSAYKHFFGKSQEEATKMFAIEYAHIYPEDVMSMPSRVFPFYIRAYAAHLLSDAARNDCSGASSFLSVIELRAQYSPNDLISSWTDIERALRKLAFEQDYFDADWSIYGSFRHKIAKLNQPDSPLSFDVLDPEIAPESVTLADTIFSMRAIPIEIAAPILARSGIVGITLGSTRDDIVKALGVPKSEGGGVATQFGFIPHWFHCAWGGCVLRFQLESGIVTSVMVMSSEALI